MDKLDRVIRVIEVYFIIEIVLNVIAIWRAWQDAQFMNCGILLPSVWGCFWQLGGVEYVIRTIVLVALGIVLDRAYFD